jgi:hypothetical protein
MILMERWRLFGRDATTTRRGAVVKVRTKVRDSERDDMPMGPSRWSVGKRGLYSCKAVTQCPPSVGNLLPREPRM